MMPQRASMEDPRSQSKNLHHLRASATEEMREQQHQFAENDVHEVKICDLMPQRASMEDPPSQSNLHHHDCASDTEEMREQQHQFVENKQHVSMSDKKTAVVVREAEICPDPRTTQKKQRVPVKDKEKAEKKKSKMKRWTKVRELCAVKEQLAALAEVQDKFGLVFQGHREVWEPTSHDGHDEQIDFTPIEEE
jgi:hypothetical protein